MEQENNRFVKKRRTFLKCFKTGWSGYMTVEATLMIPIVLYVCIFIIYSGFFVYDRCVMKQDAYRAAMKAGSVYRQDGQEVYNTAWNALEELTVDKYIATQCHYEVSVQGKVCVTVQGEVEVPFKGLEKMTGVSSWKIEEKAESQCLNPVFFIRMCRQMITKQEEE